jgi:hypothetical protein
MPSRQQLVVAGVGVAVAAILILKQRNKQKPLWRRVLRRRKHTFDQEDEQGDEQEENLPPNSPKRVPSPKHAEKCQSHVGYNKKLIIERQVAWEAVKGLERIPELDYVPSGTYVEATEEAVLWPMIENSSCIVVPGAYFGDEGKGKTVDAIARHPKVEVVARVNSGENAGHTVIGETGIKYDFHLCPSGLLTPKKINVVGPECVMDPVSFMQREISQLIDSGAAAPVTALAPPAAAAAWAPLQAAARHRTAAVMAFVAGSAAADTGASRAPARALAHPLCGPRHPRGAQASSTRSDCSSATCTWCARTTSCSTSSAAGPRPTCRHCRAWAPCTPPRLRAKGSASTTSSTIGKARTARARGWSATCARTGARSPTSASTRRRAADGPTRLHPRHRNATATTTTTTTTATSSTSPHLPHPGGWAPPPVQALLSKARANSKIQTHVLDFISAEDKAGYVLELFDKWVVHAPPGPPPEHPYPRLSALALAAPRPSGARHGGQ